MNYESQASIPRGSIDEMVEDVTETSFEDTYDDTFQDTYDKTFQGFEAPTEFYTEDMLQATDSTLEDYQELRRDYERKDLLENPEVQTYHLLDVQPVAKTERSTLSFTGDELEDQDLYQARVQEALNEYIVPELQGERPVSEGVKELSEEALTALGGLEKKLGVANDVLAEARKEFFQNNTYEATKQPHLEKAVRAYLGMVEQNRFGPTDSNPYRTDTSPAIYSGPTTYLPGQEN